jgi:hypothetical protein
MMAPELTHRLPPRRPRLIQSALETAREAIGELTPGCRLIGLTKGQFSLIDLIRAVLEQTGPSDLTISTWSTGIRDADSIQWLRETGSVRNCQLLLDYSFPQMRAGRGNAVAVVEAFGAARVRVARNHAKFALLRNEAWDVVIRSSMNLNRNPRLEQYDLDEDRELAEWFAAVVEQLFQDTPEGLQPTMREVNGAFRDALGGGLSGAYLLPDPVEEDQSASLQALLEQLRE